MDVIKTYFDRLSESPGTLWGKRQGIVQLTSGETCQYMGNATMLSKFNFSPLIELIFPSAPTISPDLSSFQSKTLLGFEGSHGASAVPLVGTGHAGFGFVELLGSFEPPNVFPTPNGLEAPNVPLEPKMPPVLPDEPNRPPPAVGCWAPADMQ